MKTRTYELIVGSALIILGAITAMGSVSLGVYQLPAQAGRGTAPYLITNYLFVLGGLALEFGGAFLFYWAGQESIDNRQQQKQRQSNGLQIEK